MELYTGEKEENMLRQVEENILELDLGEDEAE
jgi:hypothetical protein